jgi:hypothetical protein
MGKYDTATEITFEITVCIDCTHVIANGELPADSEWTDEEHTAAMLREWEDADITLACDEDCEGFFSSHDCEGCGSTLAGDRHPAVAWVPRAAWEAMVTAEVARLS